MLAARGRRRQIRPRPISSRRSGSQPSDIAVDARVRVPTESLKLKRIDIKVSRPQFRAGGKRRRRFGRARDTISPSHRRECPWFHAVQLTSQARFQATASSLRFIGEAPLRRVGDSRCQVAKAFRSRKIWVSAMSCPVAWNLLRSRSGTGAGGSVSPVARGLRDAVRGDFVSQMTELHRRPCRGSDSG